MPMLLGGSLTTHSQSTVKKEEIMTAEDADSLLNSIENINETSSDSSKSDYLISELSSLMDVSEVRLREMQASHNVAKR